MLCYGYVTFHSPPKYVQLLNLSVCVSFTAFCSLITSRVEVNILRSINPHFAKVKVSSSILMPTLYYVLPYSCAQVHTLFIMCTCANTTLLKMFITLMTTYMTW